MLGSSAKGEVKEESKLKYDFALAKGGSRIPMVDAKKCRVVEGGASGF